MSWTRAQTTRKRTSRGGTTIGSVTLAGASRRTCGRNLSHPISFLLDQHRRRPRRRDCRDRQAHQGLRAWDRPGRQGCQAAQAMRTVASQALLDRQAPRARQALLERQELRAITASTDGPALRDRPGPRAEEPHKERGGQPGLGARPGLRARLGSTGLAASLALPGPQARFRARAPRRDRARPTTQPTTGGLQCWSPWGWASELSSARGTCRSETARRGRSSQISVIVAGGRRPRPPADHPRSQPTTFWMPQTAACERCELRRWSDKVTFVRARRATRLCDNSMVLRIQT